MTRRTTIIILLIAALPYSCNKNKRGNKEVEEQAKSNIQLLDTTALRFLQSWDYTQRGKASFWTKLSGDSSIYSCSYYPSVDTPKISIYRPDNFFKDFKSDFIIDKAYYKAQLTKIGDSTLSLIGTDYQGRDKLIANDLSYFRIFPGKNPFDTLRMLTDLKDKLNVIGISHNNELGGFIQFYFPNGQHILTYLPDTLLQSSSFNKFWKTEFLKGRTLKPDWNFRKLEHPVDGG